MGEPYASPPQALLEALARADLRPTEYAVVMVVMRHCYAFRRDESAPKPLRMGDLEGATGCAHGSVASAVKRLHQLGILAVSHPVDRGVGRPANAYSFQPRTEWKPEAFRPELRTKVSSRTSDETKVRSAGRNPASESSEASDETALAPLHPPIGKIQAISLKQADDRVERLCSRMADLVAERAKRPAITVAWRREARLLLDRDARPLQEALAVMEWAAYDGFWSTNVLGLPAFRKQYDRLLLQMRRERSAGPTGALDRRVLALMGGGEA